jgi:hypothetical protein
VAIAKRGDGEVETMSVDQFATLLYGIGEAAAYLRGHAVHADDLGFTVTSVCRAL